MKIPSNFPLLFLVVYCGLLSAAQLTGGHIWGDDWAWYVLQAKSIWEGTTDEFITISNFTNYQSTSHLGPLAYPWGYPLILTPFYAIGGLSPLILKLPAVLFYLGFLLAVYFLFSSRLARTDSLFLVSLFAFNPLLIQFLDQILSDIPFLFFSTLTLHLVTGGQRRSRWRYALVGAAIFCTTFLRVTGLLLLACFLAVEFFRFGVQRTGGETLKQIGINSFIVCAAFASLWIMNAVIFPGGGESYLSQYENLTVDRVLSLIGAYFTVFSQFFGSGPGAWYLYYFLLIFSVIGAWIHRRSELYFIIFFAVTMLVNITYPYWQGPRYVFPLLPIFIYFAYQGMRFSIGKLSENYQALGRQAFYGFWILIVGYFLFTSSLSAYENMQNGRRINGPFDPVSMEVYDWVERNTPADSVLIFYKARAMRLMTNHPTIMINECNGMLKGDYLILSKKVDENNQVPPNRIKSCHLPLDKAMENRRFIIYRIEK